MTRAALLMSYHTLLAVREDGRTIMSMTISLELFANVVYGGIRRGFFEFLPVDRL